MVARLSQQKYPLGRSVLFFCAVPFFCILPATGCLSLHLENLKHLSSEEAPQPSEDASPEPPPAVVQGPESNEPPPNEPLRPDVDASLVQQFRHWLDEDGWQIDLQWSVLANATQCPSKPWRWTFFPKLASSETKAPESREKHSWKALWNGDSRTLTPHDHAAAVAALRQLQREDDRIGKNALVLRARIDHSLTPEDLGQLQKISEGLTDNSGDVSSKAILHDNLRSAAAEAWCLALTRTNSSDAETILAPAGRLLQRPGLSDELRGTLWRAMSPSILPDRLPGLAATLTLDHQGTTAPSLRIAALESCVIAAVVRRGKYPDEKFRANDWPSGLLALRLDENPIVRRLVGRWAAWVRTPAAQQILVMQQNDVDPEVVQSAIFGLGLSGSSEALTTLHDIAADQRSNRAATAVMALSLFGTPQLEAYAASPQSQLRLAVARGMTGQHDRHAQVILRRLLSDPSPDVQSEALAAVSGLPTETAIPLMLLAAETSCFEVRKSAQLELTRRLPDAPLLPIDGSMNERRDAVRRWATEHGYALDPLPLTSDLGHTPEAVQHRHEMANLLEAYFHPEATSETQEDLLSRLRRQITLEDLPQIETCLAQRPGPRTVAIQQKVLPIVSPAYAALNEFRSADLASRRHAANQLQTISQKRPLSPEFLRILNPLLVHEQDHLIWQYCLMAIREDGHAAAGQMAILAIHHIWPDLRKLGAEHFIRHPDPEAVTSLLPLLSDQHQQVQLVAIEALGRCGNPIAIAGLPARDEAPALPGLQMKKHDGADDIRWAAIRALVQLRDAETVNQLQQLLSDSNPRERYQAIITMGHSSQSRFIEPLVQAGWTETSETNRRAILKSLNNLVAEEDRPATLRQSAGLVSIDDQIQSWVKWWDARRATATVRD